jgi:flagellar basal body P-ring protein FlgI
VQSGTLESDCDLIHWNNFSEVFDIHSSKASSIMSLSSINVGPANEFPGVALVTGAAGSGESLRLWFVGR